MGGASRKGRHLTLTPCPPYTHTHTHTHTRAHTHRYSRPTVERKAQVLGTVCREKGDCGRSETVWVNQWQVVGSRAGLSSAVTHREAKNISCNPERERHTHTHTYRERGREGGRRWKWGEQKKKRETETGETPENLTCASYTNKIAPPYGFLSQLPANSACWPRAINSQIVFFFFFKHSKKDATLPSTSLSLALSLSFLLRVAGFHDSAAVSWSRLLRWLPALASRVSLIRSNHTPGLQNRQL